MEYGNRLKQIREMKGYLTRQSLADKFTEITGAKFNQQSIGRFERQENEPNLDQLALYSKTLDVSVDYLLGLNDVSIKDAELQSISKTIGLSEDALNNLINMNEMDRKFFLTFFNSILEDTKALSDFTECIRKYCVQTEITIDVHKGTPEGKHFLTLSPEALNRIISYTKEEIINQFVRCLDLIKDKFQKTGSEVVVLSTNDFSYQSVEELGSNK